MVYVLYPPTAMRVICAFCLAVLSVGCAGPHSSGALWAQQSVEQERALFQLDDARRAERAHAFDLGVADEWLSSERQRISTELQACPGPRQTLTVSPGDRLRDAFRVRAQGDIARLTGVAAVALTDWYVRRASATQQTELCDQARAALAGVASTAPPSAANLLSGLPAATVTRDPNPSAVELDTNPPMVALGEYALGYVDALQAPAPLPQYLARVYGGVLVPASDASTAVDDEAVAVMVDRDASAYPEWEPDALYAALSGSQR